MAVKSCGVARGIVRAYHLLYLKLNCEVNCTSTRSDSLTVTVKSCAKISEMKQ
jgi:hypothetical protein